MTAELTPVVVDGLVHYRLVGAHDRGQLAIELRVDGHPERGGIARLDDKAFAST